MKYAARSIKGIRAENQDHVFVPSSGGAPIAVVADGMGGHKAGGVASQIAIDALTSYINGEVCHRSGVAGILRGIESANAAVFERSRDEDCSGMGTTLVVALVSGSDYIAANVGDSRLYQYSADTGELSQITLDHSYVAELVSLGIITNEEAAYHPRRNIITRAIGTRSSERADVFEREWEAGDMLLLCTDGLHGTLGKTEMAAIISKHASDIESACEELVDTALRSGSMDNISAVIVLNAEDGE